MRLGVTSQSRISLRSSGVKSSRSFLSPALYLMRAIGFVVMCSLLNAEVNSVVDHRVAVIPAVFKPDARQVIVTGEPATLCLHVLFALLRRVRLLRPEQNDRSKGTGLV
jgi:hypothetical protein